MGGEILETGRIFSIEELALHDGPGIRMTVFLKGCPLRCMWCHSPEGQSFLPEWVRAPNGCLHCGVCLEKGREISGQSILVRESADACPRNLIRLSGEEYTSEALVARIQKNATALNACGGGVTFSGGEPLAQPRFLAECLEQLHGVTHRALQTSGYAPTTVFAEILKKCDYVLFDLKLMDTQQHRTYCGADNDVILHNYRTLAMSGTDFITRTPLIPTVNDTVENITATARFLQENGVHRVELLPYHSLTGSKYAMLGRTYAPDFDESRIPERHLEIFQSYQIEVTEL